jgi:hypothetical protein
MSGKRDAARAALRNVDKLHDVHHEPILNALDVAGLLDNERSGNGGAVRAVATAVPGRGTLHDARRDAVLTMMQAAAADQRNVEMLRIIRAHARRLGIGSLFADESKPVDADALNVALRDKPLADRWRMKEMLYMLRLIPA